jgi:hypothetical protein
VRNYLLGGAVLAVAAVVVAIIITSNQGGHSTPVATHSSTTPTTATSTIQPATTSTSASTASATVATTTSSTIPAVISPAGGPVPPGFAPRSFTAISEFTWWLLGTAPCSRPPCTSIVRTVNGGRSFVGIPAPRTGLAGNALGSGVSQLRFADSHDGSAYGGGLWVTHNGGASWQAMTLGGRVTDLTIGAGNVYAIVQSPSNGSGQLMVSPVNHDAWRTLSLPSNQLSGLWAHQSDLLVGTQGNSLSQMHLLVSHDAGASFTAYHSPSAGLGCEFQQLEPPVIWAHCATGTESGVWRSSNGGAKFQLAEGSSASGLMLPNSAAFGAASSSTAVVGGQQLYRTSNGGASYAPVGPSDIQSWSYLGFTDSTHGVAIGFTGSNWRLYYTTDSGLGYHLVPIQAA